MKRAQWIVLCLLILCPLLYLFFTWGSLPDRVPIHFNMKGEADRIGSKTELLWLIIFLVGLNFGIFAIVMYSAKLDPKKEYTTANKAGINKIAFAVSIFLTVITMFVIYSVNKSANGSIARGDFVLSAVGLLFCVLGNYMHSIKPNHTVGFRLLSTLKDEDNWKKTHRLGGKLWFWGGLLIAVLSVLLPSKPSFIAFWIITFVLVVVPVIYSMRLQSKGRSLG